MIHIVHFYLFPVPQSSMQQDTHQSPSQSFPGPFILPAPQPVIPFPLWITAPSPRVALPTMSPGNLNYEPGFIPITFPLNPPTPPLNPLHQSYQIRLGGSYASYGELYQTTGRPFPSLDQTLYPLHLSQGNQPVPQSMAEHVTSGVGLQEAHLSEHEEDTEQVLPRSTSY